MQLKFKGRGLTAQMPTSALISNIKVGFEGVFNFAFIFKLNANRTEGRQSVRLCLIPPPKGPDPDVLRHPETLSARGSSGEALSGGGVLPLLRHAVGRTALRTRGVSSPPPS